MKRFSLFLKCFFVASVAIFLISCEKEKENKDEDKLFEGKVAYIVNYGVILVAVEK